MPLQAAIDHFFPNAGVDVLKGGDHGAKVAAERRFKRPDGPRVLISTAAGREGINLQFARVLFNHDLPWNPMDLEQRIGRIHRYGQAHTAQVYNLVSADTIEGQIFLLLEEKLMEIAKTLGKVDESGQVAEDLRGQILGQLSERLSYEKLYQDAVRDPRLVRTRQELEVAVENATTARQVVWELFQDLEGFRLDDYKKMDDRGEGMARLMRYVDRSIAAKGGKCVRISADQVEVVQDSRPRLRFTTSREAAMKDDNLSLLGLEHPLVKDLLERDRELEANARAFSTTSPASESKPAVLTIWHVLLQDDAAHVTQKIALIGLDHDGKRDSVVEQLTDSFETLSPSVASSFAHARRQEFVASILPDMLRRDLAYKGEMLDSATMAWRLLGWVEVS